MEILEIALAFAAGLLIGSFLNVCIYRLPLDLSVLKPARSFCPKCEKTIAWYDNIPLVSFALLAGKCRQCGEQISLRYPLVELLTGAVFAYCLIRYGQTVLALKLAIFCAIQIALIATDIEERILPDEFTLGGTLLGLILAFFAPVEVGFSYFFLGVDTDPRWLSVTDAAIGAGVACFVVWFIRWAYEKVRHREGMGLGDVKMMAMVGAFLGIYLALGTMFVASVLGSVVGLVFIALAKKGTDYELPFGSFLGFAAIVVALGAS